MMTAHEIIAERQRLKSLLCPECEGRCSVPIEIESSQGRMQLRSTCKRCNGRGVAKEVAKVGVVFHPPIFYSE
jgi:DnaJ-class molecular chaperone